MGYTHYFPQKSEISPEAWNLITMDVNKVLESLQASGMVLESNHPSGLMVTPEYINFNGRVSGHETFSITRKQKPGFNFCKTARKHYDQAVMCALLIVEFHAPGSLQISSDGGLDEWEDGVRTNARILGFTTSFPESIASEDDDRAQEILESLC